MASADNNKSVGQCAGQNTLPEELKTNPKQDWKTRLVAHTILSNFIPKSSNKSACIVSWAILTETACCGMRYQFSIKSLLTVEGSQFGQHNKTKLCELRQSICSTDCGKLQS